MWETRLLHIHSRSHAVVRTCHPLIGSGQNHLARHNKRGKKTRQTEEEVGRQHQRMDRLGVCQVPQDSGEQRKMEETGCEVILGAPTTLAVQRTVRVKKVIFIVQCVQWLRVSENLCLRQRSLTSPIIRSGIRNRYTSIFLLSFWSCLLIIGIWES